jgi:ArsR family transcriptional regulator
MAPKPKIDRMFQAFADPTRLRILHLLVRGELCVCDLTETLQIPQSKVSRHLAYLKASSLVLDRRDGLWKYYALTKTEGKFHRKLISCLKSCFDEVDVLRQDLGRLKTRRRRNRC